MGARSKVRRALVAIVGVVIMSAGAPVAQAASCNDLGPGQWDCSVDGRDVNIYVPASYDGTSAVPAVVDMHGYTSNNGSQQSISGWDAFADVEGFIVAYPQGESNSWNAQGSCCGSSNEDDVTFIRNVVAHVQAAANIDGTRIYATGLSNGGSMTHTLACEAADLFTAASAVSFGLSGGSSFNQIVANCQATLSEGIPVIHFHGTNDGIVSYENGVLDSLGAEESLEAWRQVQSASSASTTQALSSNTSCKTHSNGLDGAQVSMCTVDGGSHGLYSDVAGAGIPSFSWDFFQGLFDDGGSGGGGSGGDVIFEEGFDSGLGQFSASGSVYTGSYGVRMRGGSSEGVIVSPQISTQGFSDVTLTFDRNTDGTLDSGEFGYAEVSVDGGSTFTVVEQTQDAARSRVSFSLGAEAANQPDLVLRFRIDASSFYEEYEVDDVLLEGAGGTQNSPPTASFTSSCTDLTCDFNGSGSTDPDGSIQSYDWDFGDGVTDSGATVSHTYAGDGTFTVTLTVTDDAGATDGQSQDVTVSSGSTGGGVIFEESFDSGLGQFSASGNVYTGSYGVRMRGGSSDGVIVSPQISTQGFSDVTLTFDRNTDGTLDSGEFGYAEVSVDGGSTYSVVEQTQDATRSRVSFSLGAEAANQPDLVLRFRIDANSFYEEYEVDEVLLEGS